MLTRVLSVSKERVRSGEKFGTATKDDILCRSMVFVRRGQSREFA